MKKIRRLYQYKGFTLVECVVAIAVFAVLTSMIMLILAQTTQLSKTSVDNEENLNDLVQNVVADKSPKVYGADSDTLELTVAGTTGFKMTYTTIDGVKNYIKCPHTVFKADGSVDSRCSYTGNLVDYLDYIYDSTEYTAATAADKAEHKITHWFGTGTNTNLKCPECENSFDYTKFKFKCLACETEGALSFTSASGSMYLNRETGVITCSTCGSGNVVQSGYNDGTLVSDGIIDADGNMNQNVTSDSRFMITGIRPNAIRYGNVEPKADKDLIKQLISVSSTCDTPVENYNIIIQAQPKASLISPVTYKVTLNVTDTIGDATADDGTTSPGTASVRLKLPGTFICDVQTGAGYNVLGKTATPDTSKPTVSVIDSEEIKRADKESTIQIANITQVNKAGGIVFTFTLTNYGNAHNFEDDYVTEFKKAGGSGTYSASDCALTRYWFRSTSSAINCPRPDSNILVPATT